MVIDKSTYHMYSFSLHANMHFSPLLSNMSRYCAQAHDHNAHGKILRWQWIMRVSHPSQRWTIACPIPQFHACRFLWRKVIHYRLIHPVLVLHLLVAWGNIKEHRECLFLFYITLSHLAKPVCCIVNSHPSHDCSRHTKKHVSNSANLFTTKLSLPLHRLVCLIKYIPLLIIRGSIQIVILTEKQFSRRHDARFISS